MEIDGERMEAEFTGLSPKECDVMTGSALSVAVFKVFPVARPRRFASRPELSACPRFCHRRTADCHQPELALQNRIHLAPSRLKNSINLIYIQELNLLYLARNKHSPLQKQSV